MRTYFSTHQLGLAVREKDWEHLQGGAGEVSDGDQDLANHSPVHRRSWVSVIGVEVHSGESGFFFKK